MEVVTLILAGACLFVAYCTIEADRNKNHESCKPKKDKINDK